MAFSITDLQKQPVREIHGLCKQENTDTTNKNRSHQHFANVDIDKKG